MDQREQPGHLCTRERTCGVEAWGGEGVRSRVDTIEHQGLKVQVEVQGRAEALDLNDCAAAAVVDQVCEPPCAIQLSSSKLPATQSFVPVAVRESPPPTVV